MRESSLSSRPGASFLDTRIRGYDMDTQARLAGANNHHTSTPAPADTFTHLIQIRLAIIATEDVRHTPDLR
jgi:hypothetical protein